MYIKANLKCIKANFDTWLTFAARDRDKRRLNTALFMTEFGAVGTSATGLREVTVVADGADALQPPASWAYWAWDQFKGSVKTINQCINPATPSKECA